MPRSREEIKEIYQNFIKKYKEKFGAEIPKDTLKEISSMVLRKREELFFKQCLDHIPDIDFNLFHDCVCYIEIEPLTQKANDPKKAGGKSG